MTEPASETIPEPTAPTTEPAAPTVPEAPPLAAVAEPAAPDYSALKLPEGYAADAPAIVALREAALAHKIPVEALQAQIEGLAKLDADAAAASIKAAEEQARGWREELKADKELGGAKFDENVAHARRWIKSYGGEPLEQALIASGLIDFPPLVRALMKAGKDAGEAPVIGAAAPPAGDPYRAMYPNSPMLWQQ